jgi:hypothetical protein
MCPWVPQVLREVAEDVGEFDVKVYSLRTELEKRGGGGWQQR